MHSKFIRRELQAVSVMFIVSILTLERTLTISQQDRLYDPLTPFRCLSRSNCGVRSAAVFESRRRFRFKETSMNRHRAGTAALSALVLVSSQSMRCRPSGFDFALLSTC